MQNRSWISRTDHSYIRSFAGSEWLAYLRFVDIAIFRFSTEPYRQAGRHKRPSRKTHGPKKHEITRQRQTVGEQELMLCCIGLDRLGS